MDAQLPQDHHKSSLTVLELFALPGAGKSTVVEAIAKQMLVTTRKNITADWANRSALQRLAHVGRAFTDFALLTATVRFALGARLGTRDSLFRLMRLVAKTEWLRSRSGTLLLDQGFLQDIWSILLSSRTACPDPAILCSLIRSLYKGTDTTIVVLEVDSNTASARVSGRMHGGSRFDRLPEGRLRSSIEAVSGLQLQIVEAARLAGLPVLMIDASPPAEVVADRLRSLFPAMQMRTSVDRAE